MRALLKVVGLRVQYVESREKTIRAVNGVSLELRPSEVLGILGESGCGKSTLARTVLRLLPKKASVTEGSIEFEQQNLLGLSENELTKIRGATIAMVPQEPGSALNPVMKIGDQIAEVLRAHRNWSRRECREAAELLLERVQLHDADRRMYDAFPLQLSGGEQQRVAIAQAIACEPALLIADEPTASLDSETEEGILQLLRHLKAEKRMALLLITHDPKILVGLADRVAVMYAGKIVEESTCEELFRAPKHPYTQALLACIPPAPDQEGFGARRQIPEIAGSAPDPEFVVSGCSFAPRCPQRLTQCDSHSPSAIELEPARRVECFLYGG